MAYDSDFTSHVQGPSVSSCTSCVKFPWLCPCSRSESACILGNRSTSEFFSWQEAMEHIQMNNPHGFQFVYLRHWMGISDDLLGYSLNSFKGRDSEEGQWLIWVTMHEMICLMHSFLQTWKRWLKPYYCSVPWYHLQRRLIVHIVALMICEMESKLAYHIRLFCL